MKIDITTVNTSISEQEREITENKLEKFHRFFDEDAACQVKVRNEGKEMRVEITIKIRRDILRAEAKETEYITALEGAIDKLEGKLRKQKTKLKKRRQTDKALSEYLDTLPELEPTPAVPTAAQVVRHKTFNIEPMSPEEAALQMELIDHDFFLYLDPETGMVRVLYKREDGDYGILEPQY
ncbi:MAG: ribosome-associated translation inhibitor RaiA [Eubacteriales bacterium]|nr:ribosome-associated translation inhibitor RaiA [Eubacteriales bacterium]